MMTLARRLLFLLIALLAASANAAAPDEASLGRAEGYPAARSLKQAYTEPYLVGSFSAMDSFNPSCTLAPADDPLVLKKAAIETPFNYRFHGRKLTLDDYMQRQRATGLLVVKDGEIVAERYNYMRSADMRMLSNSMAKTITALAIVKAQEEGFIRSLDDTAETYVPQLKDTLYGQTRIVNLMRMSSGARYIEDYSGHDDRARFNEAVRRVGVAQAARLITARSDPEGRRFNYAGAQTQILGLVVRGATNRTLCDYVDEKLWKPIGAQARATWLVNPVDREEFAQGAFNATLRDYARLGLMMATDGLVRGTGVVSRDHLLAMTDAARQPEAFRPGYMQYHGSTHYGYGLQTWILPGSHRRFALLGVYGQAIFVDPALNLVVVHTAVGKDATGDASGAHLGAERDALLRGIVSAYGDW
ncbi:serine hydrolase domain-containing protein [Cupriavidus basilensis]|uniref:serine hydrolase domain-containing protein n=1 Tax=Cupriavidus basilensis TaxID=68895 RepID=UPI0023E7C891|nr:serine hydrolase domain-containing protein [Cupriavidus basilensis]MDF3887947.1 serine hydrolase [Cupriavidus basilensis]